MIKKETIHTIYRLANVRLMQMLPLTKLTQPHHIPSSDRFFGRHVPIAEDERFSTIRLMLLSFYHNFFLFIQRLNIKQRKCKQK